MLLIAVVALLVWRIASIGMSSHYVELLKEGEDRVATKALVWNDRQPEALYRQAIARRDADPETALRQLARAYAENPADARSLMAMADIAQVQGDQARADALVDTAVGLMPVDPRVQKGAASYWVSQGELEKAMKHWSLALESDASARKQLFPILLKLAEDPRTRFAFKPLAVSPPTWWNSFFAEVSKRAFDVETVRLLYSLRLESPRVPLTEPERKAYVARLKKEGMISEAFIHWANGLSSEQRAQLGLLYAGGFELEPHNWGFDWHLRSGRGALIDRARTYGVDGDQALHILFNRHTGQFQGVFQSLFLDPAPYRLTGRVRTDSLETKGGLKWVLRCLHPDTMDLGESERFLGSNQWRSFDFEFQVPASCALQEIRLVSTGKRAFEHEITGGAWFDRMAIRKIPKLSRLPNAGPTGIDGSSSGTPDSPLPRAMETQ